MTMSHILRKSLALALSGSMLTGCSTVTRDLPGGLYAKGSVAPLGVPARVVVVRNPGEPLEARKTIRMQGSSTGVVRLQSYAQSVAEMLATVYDTVEVSSTAAEAQGADFLVYMSTAFPRRVDLTFKTSGPDASSTALSVEGARILDYTDGFLLVMCVVPFLLPICMGTSHRRAEEAAGNVEKTLVGLIPRALAEIRERIVSDDAFNPPARRAAMAKYEAAGDFVQAAVHSMPGSETALRLQAKVAEAGLTGQPSDEARELMARGKAAVALAKDPGEFRRASDYMERALVLAPWWATGHFNTGLAEEGAGLWAPAAKHFRIYLKLKPDAEDKDKVFQKIAELAIRLEKKDLPARAP